MTFLSTGNTITWLYTATGRKLQKRTCQSGSAAVSPPPATLNPPDKHQFYTARFDTLGSARLPGTETLTEAQYYQHLRQRVQNIKLLLPPTFSYASTTPPPALPPPTTCNKRDYIGPVEYYNNTAEAYYHQEGRINLLPGMNKRYEYTLHDHLGNARIFFADANNDGTAEILQQTNYYPFGLPIQELSTNFEAADGVEANNYQYNGIELVEDFGLQVNHAQFRTLNPQTGAWWQIDPMAEKFYAWSPYNSNLGNPVRYDDPKGDTPGPGGADKQPANRNDIDAGGGGGAALGWSIIALGEALLKGFGIGAGADATVQIADKKMNEGMSISEAVANVDVTSCAISGVFCAIGTGAVYNLSVIGGATKANELISATVITAGLSVQESVYKQAFDGKSGSLNGNQLLTDVSVDVLVGGTAKIAEPKIASNGGKIALEAGSEVTSNTAQNMLNSKPIQKNSNPYHNQNKHAPQALEKHLW